jgi:hypothetical protein
VLDRLPIGNPYRPYASLNNDESNALGSRAARDRACKSVFGDRRSCLRRQERVWRAQRPGAKIEAIATSGRDRDSRGESLLSAVTAGSALNFRAIAANIQELFRSLDKPAFADLPFFVGG